MQFQKSKNTLLNLPSEFKQPLSLQNQTEFCQTIFSNENHEKFNCFQDQQKIAYTRVADHQLQNQISIYQWRKNIPNHIIPIFQYKVLSSGNIFNPNPLIKITLSYYRKTLKSVEKLSIGQSLSLLSQIIIGAKIVFQHFGYSQITEKMVIIDEQGKVRLWVCEQFHLNPFNKLTKTEEQPKTQKQAIQSIIHIIQKKCLQNKLSKELFGFIQQKHTFAQLQAAIIRYQIQKKIIVPNSIRPFSVNTKATLFGSTSIRLGINKSNQENLLKKITRTQNQILNQIFCQDNQLYKSDKFKLNIKTSNLTRAHSDYLQISPQQRNNVIKNSNSKILDLSQAQKKPYSVNQSTSFLSKLQDKRKLSLKSCVFQQKIDNTKQNTSNNELSLNKIKQIQSPKLSELSDDHFNTSQQIIQKNGWNNFFIGLPLKSQSILKKSIIYENDQNAYLQDIQFKKLDKMGRMLTRSIFPQDQQDL